jgi:hypothetical protein
MDACYVSRSALIRGMPGGVPAFVNPLDCSALDPLAAGHAVGALDPIERRAVADHLGRCDRPHPALRESHVVAAAMGAALAPPCRPSDALRTAILDAIRADRR